MILVPAAADLNIRSAAAKMHNIKSPESGAFLLLNFMFCQIRDILFPENAELRDRLQQDNRIHYMVCEAPCGHRFRPEMLHNMMLNGLLHRVDCDDG